MQSIAEYNAELLEQARQIQQYINAGDREGLNSYIRSLRSNYVPPEYLKQQGLQ